MEPVKRFEQISVGAGRPAGLMPAAVVGLAIAVMALGLLGPKAAQPTPAQAPRASAIPDSVATTRESTPPKVRSSLADVRPAPGRALDLGGLSLARTAAGALPVGDGDLAVGFGSIWLVTESDRTLRRLDPTTLEVVAVVDVPPPHSGTSRPMDVLVGGDAIWVVGPDPGIVHRFDAARPASPTSMNLGGDIRFAVTGFRALWAGRADGSLVRVDLRRTGQTSTIALGSAPVALGVGGAAIWISTEDGSLLRVEPAGREVAARYPIGGGRIAIGSGRIWVADDRRIARVNETTGRTDIVAAYAPSTFDAELFTHPPDRRESRISPNRAGLAMGLGVWWRWDPGSGTLSRTPRRG